MAGLGLWNRDVGPCTWVLWQGPSEASGLSKSGGLTSTCMYRLCGLGKPYDLLDPLFLLL